MCKNSLISVKNVTLVFVKKTKIEAKKFHDFLLCKVKAASRIYINYKQRISTKKGETHFLFNVESNKIN